ncbi:multifunctional methyltransferase subunit TRM112-like protein [Pollicipes pollicipes]|uniref:multifunctional methyltransferase subunit TRM112-like protein n=1 Tax=Pollicipes pollicipes TaxID=41117 RepID=UPI0018857394|nr:multifunctional methyltransferase subunit TRM112-like protein [Pollicipes pollicipes]XP_037080306.1 multifunctional methyltransferase subunit TRM112-like protein [Pollicipes pollicipes]XP_037080486.1 multifunctional methyltransferase subunit TRM112-like protein [Pollicipes pollicipes]
MKLLTHNMLTSKCLKNVVSGYPLQISINSPEDVKVQEVDFNPEFIARIIPKVDWDVLCKTAEEVGHKGDLPATLDQDYETNEEFLKMAHHVLLEVEVMSGELVCPETGRRFPVTDGIPNMLLNEDEV